MSQPLDLGRVPKNIELKKLRICHNLFIAADAGVAPDSVAFILVILLSAVQNVGNEMKSKNRLSPIIKGIKLISLFWLGAGLVGCTGKGFDSLGGGSGAAGVSDQAITADPFKNQIPLQNRINSKAALVVTGLATTNAAGTVQVVSWLDPQEPFSARTYNALRSASRTTPRISYVLRFKTDPAVLNSRLKARYLYAANAQGKMFEAADIIFNGVLNLNTEADIQAKLKEVGINIPSLLAALALPATDASITADEAALSALGSAVAPSIYINGIRIYDFEVQSAAHVAATLVKLGL